MEPSRRPSHAVVLGGGIAGLAAAGVLASRFQQVTVLERDPVPEDREPRKGVPQGRHVHILLKAGEEALEAVFPGIVDELETLGSCRVDFANDFGWFHHGVWKARYEAPRFLMRMQSRPFLEAALRRRLEGLGNVRIRYRTEAAGIEVQDGRATAVLVREADQGGPGTPEPASLIVDASGRGSQLPRWLERFGYRAPREERLGVDLQYASRTYRAWPDPARSWKSLLIYQRPPGETRVGGLFPAEDGRWIVTMAGYCGDHPSGDEAGFLDFARSLARPAIYEAIRDAEPLSEVKTFRFPYARWLHYEELRRFPAGLVPLGDTVCSFDPVFGQGMSVAAKEARLLAAHLDRDPGAADVRPYLRRLESVIAVPWLLTSSEDLRYPQVQGRRPLWLPLLQRYTRQVFLASGSVPVYGKFLRVLHLLDGPELLFHPAVVAGVLGRILRPRPKPAVGAGQLTEAS